MKKPTPVPTAESTSDDRANVPTKSLYIFLPPADVARWNREQAAKPTKH